MSCWRIYDRLQLPVGKIRIRCKRLEVCRNDTHIYKLKNCVSKKVTFANNLRIYVSSKILGKKQKKSDLVINDVIVKLAKNRMELNVIIFEVCIRERIPLAYCKHDDNKNKQEHKKNEKENDPEKQETENQEEERNLQLQEKPQKEPVNNEMQSVKATQTVEEDGIAGLKWIECFTACPAAAGVGLYIGVKLNLCQKFQVDPDQLTIVYSDDSDPDLIPIGGTAIVECTDPSAIFYGPSTLKCINPFQWNIYDENFPYCYYECPANLDALIKNPSPPLEANVEYSEAVVNGIVDEDSTATIECYSTATTDFDLVTETANGQKLSDNPNVVTCSKNKWNMNGKEVTSFKCGHRCSKLTIEGSKGILYTDEYADGTSITHGGTATVVCDSCSTSVQITDKWKIFDNGQWKNFEPERCILGLEHCKNNLPQYAATTDYMWDMCIVYMNDILFTWEEAKVECSKLCDGSLLYFPKDHRDDLFGLLTQWGIGADTWIGLRQIDNIGLVNHAEGWQWHVANGNIVDAVDVSWGSIDPNDNFDIAEDCGAYSRYFANPM